MNADVVAVLTNWRRPQNIGLIAAALQPQCRVVLIDNGEGRRDWSALGWLEDVWTIQKNHGPPVRWTAALAQLDCQYVLLLDDDLVPGPQCVAHLTATAQRVDNQFATIGCFGRVFPPRENNQPGLQYTSRNAERSAVEPVTTDMTCRGHLVNAALMPLALTFRWELAAKWKATNGDPECLHIHDDLFLCLGIQRGTQYPSYTAARQDDSREMRFRELDAAHAVSTRTRHAIERSTLIRAAGELGWQSLRRKHPTATIYER